MNSGPDEVGNEIFLLEFEESREIRNCIGGFAVIGQNSVRCQNTVLSLDDQNHTNCQHRLTFSKSANFSSFQHQQPSSVIEFLIFYDRVALVLYSVQ